jgi:mRNA-degrading endonuclease RelE of RelBE toxin-antitoxin system
MPYDIFIHELAVEELALLRAFDQRRIITEIREQLTDHPGVPTKKRKCLVDLVPTFEHEMPVWELRVGDFRVFYDVQDDEC